MVKFLSLGSLYFPHLPLRILQIPFEPVCSSVDSVLPFDGNSFPVFLGPFLVVPAGQTIECKCLALCIEFLFEPECQKEKPHKQSQTALVRFAVGELILFTAVYD